MLEVGAIAPDFTLFDQEGTEIKLSNYRGNKVILYFYPKDSTPGCTRQACAFQIAISDYQAQNITVIGISKDSEKSHKNFATKQGLTFTLVSDPERIAIEAYDVWKEKKLYGKVNMGVVRTTYVIDEEGKIEKVYDKVKPDINATEILEYLKEQAN